MRTGLSPCSISLRGASDLEQPSPEPRVTALASGVMQRAWPFGSASLSSGTFNNYYLSLSFLIGKGRHSDRHHGATCGNEMGRCARGLAETCLWQTRPFLLSGH